MMRIVPLGLLLATGLVLGGCPVAAVGPGSIADLNATPGEFADCRVPGSEETWAAEILQRVNDERTRRGLTALEPSDKLARQAGAYACEMIHYGFMDHANPTTGSTTADRVLASGFEGNLFGENLAAGDMTPAQVVAGWMDSPPHRATLLTAGFTHLGVGIRRGGVYGTYWVQLFGGP